MSSYINPANAVTASRFLTIPPFIYCIDTGRYQWATVVIIICGLLDVLDGLVAKWFDCRSGFGEVFDAVADGTCYGTFLLTLAIYRWVPWEPVVFVAVLGVINTLMRVVYARRAGRTTNYRSFAMERIAAFSAFLIGAGVNHFSVTFYYYSFAGLMLVVLLHDTKRMLIDPVAS